MHEGCLSSSLNIPLYLHIKERGYLQNSSIDQVYIYPREAPAVANIRGTSLQE